MWPQTKNRRRGAALVEFALILPILLMLFLGIIEFGVLFLHQLTLVQVGREGSRHASLGKPVAAIEERIVNTAGALPNHDELTIDLSYSTDEGLTYPYALGDVGGGSENSAPPGTLIKVTLNWPHHLITGSFFSWLSGVQGDALPLKSEVVMRRE
ncbi:MAG: pilus assembly protein [Armatimonadota bacterium]|nr:MAG: pilus assembly protein [Armatimonadota bacterium]